MLGGNTPVREDLGTEAAGQHGPGAEQLVQHDRAPDEAVEGMLGGEADAGQHLLAVARPPGAPGGRRRTSPWRRRPGRVLPRGVEQRGRRLHSHQRIGQAVTDGLKADRSSARTAPGRARAGGPARAWCVTRRRARGRGRAARAHSASAHGTGPRHDAAGDVDVTRDLDQPERGVEPGDLTQLEGCSGTTSTRQERPRPRVDDDEGRVAGGQCAERHPAHDDIDRGAATPGPAPPAAGEGRRRQAGSSVRPSPRREHPVQCGRRGVGRALALEEHRHRGLRVGVERVEPSRARPARHRAPRHVADAVASRMPRANSASSARSISGRPRARGARRAMMLRWISALPP